MYPSNSSVACTCGCTASSWAALWEAICRGANPAVDSDPTERASCLDGDRAVMNVCLGCWVLDMADTTPNGSQCVCVCMCKRHVCRGTGYACLLCPLKQDMVHSNLFFSPHSCPLRHRCRVTQRQRSLQQCHTLQLLPCVRGVLHAATIPVIRWLQDTRDTSWVSSVVHHVQPRRSSSPLAPCLAGIPCRAAGHCTQAAHQCNSGTPAWKATPCV